MNYIIRVTVGDNVKAFYAKNINMEKSTLQTVLQSVIKSNYTVTVLTGKKNHRTVVKGLEELIQTVQNIRCFKKVRVKRIKECRDKICECSEWPFSLQYVGYIGITMIHDYNSRIIEHRDAAIEDILGRFHIARTGIPYVWGHYVVDGNTVYKILQIEEETIEEVEL
jgi:hypothetical protein